MTNQTNLCACAICGGTECQCGCQTQTAEPITCQCGPDCTCGVGCTCPACRGGKGTQVESR